MPKRLLKLVSESLGRAAVAPPPTYSFDVKDIAWAMGSFCALNRKPFDAELLARQFPPPYTSDAFIHAARALGFRIKRRDCDPAALSGFNFPCLALLYAAAAAPTTHVAPSGDTAPAPTAADLTPEITLDPPVPPRKVHPAIVVQANPESVTLFEAGTNTQKVLRLAEFAARFAGTGFQLALETKALDDPDGALSGRAAFGFHWFVPELLKHRHVWRDVLIASLIIQLLALATPLFTQVIIDKVVVHRTQSTLIVIGIGLAVFMVFSALLSWVRQYLILHTGNRVDAVLGAAVFSHLFKLPTRYFEHRPTGVIAARLHGVETIREFIASTAVTLILDLPFLLIFLGMMFYYSVVLTCIALTIMGLIVLMSFIVAPLFRKHLNQQFLLGARNQAFTTEYIGGVETVKSLQMEPQLNARYSDYLAEYLNAGFKVRQIGNTYNTLSNGLEQMMTLLILVVGAYTVMNSSTDTGGQVFSIGMLIAFQMYASKVSQPMLRLVGLWQQFQQANLSVQRLGDLMNAPAEPYSLLPTRVNEGRGQIDIEALSFRYAEDRPFLYRAPTASFLQSNKVHKTRMNKRLRAFCCPM